MNEQNGSTLSVGNYSIEVTAGGFGVFITKELGEKMWLADAADPGVAMQIVEGLILVEMKRFHYPDSTPTFKDGSGNPLPPFLRKGSEGS